MIKRLFFLSLLSFFIRLCPSLVQRLFPEVGSIPANTHDTVMVALLTRASDCTLFMPWKRLLAWCTFGGAVSIGLLSEEIPPGVAAVTLALLPAIVMACWAIIVVCDARWLLRIKRVESGENVCVNCGYFLPQPSEITAHARCPECGVEVGGVCGSANLKRAIRWLPHRSSLPILEEFESPAQATEMLAIAFSRHPIIERHRLKAALGIAVAVVIAWFIGLFLFLDDHTYLPTRWDRVKELLPPISVVIALAGWRCWCILTIRSELRTMLGDPQAHKPSGLEWLRDIKRQDPPPGWM